MNTQMPHFEWSIEDKSKLLVGSTVTRYWELGVTTETIYSEGYYYPTLDDEHAKIQVSPNKFVTLSHCDPNTLKAREPHEHDL